MVLDLAPAGDPLQSLPTIDGDGSLWPDRVDGSQYWYAPEFSVVEPALPVTASTSPFVFSFRTVGHDAEGRPGLEATIRLTLRMRMSDGDRRGLGGAGPSDGAARSGHRPVDLPPGPLS